MLKSNELEQKVALCKVINWYLGTASNVHAVEPTQGHMPKWDIRLHNNSHGTQGHQELEAAVESILTLGVLEVRDDADHHKLNVKEGVSLDHAFETILRAASDKVDQRHVQVRGELAELAEKMGTKLDPIHNVGRVQKVNEIPGLTNAFVY